MYFVSLINRRDLWIDNKVGELVINLLILLLQLLGLSGKDKFWINDESREVELEVGANDFRLGLAVIFFFTFFFTVVTIVGIVIVIILSITFVFCIVPELWLLFIQVDSSLLELVHEFKLLGSADAAAKRIDTSLLRVPVRRRVRNTERAVDSMAVMDWSWAIIIIVVAILAHIVSSKAVPYSH